MKKKLQKQEIPKYPNFVLVDNKITYLFKKALENASGASFSDEDVIDTEQPVIIDNQTGSFFTPLPAQQDGISIPITTLPSTSVPLDVQKNP